MDEEIRCPFYVNGRQCSGSLVCSGHGQTYLGTINGIDANEHSETFRCDACGRKFVRTWQWSEGG